MSDRLVAARLLDDRNLDDLDAIATLLPSDVRELYALQTRCLDAARKAVHRGQGFEVRRLSDLACQLGKRAEARSDSSGERR